MKIINMSDIHGDFETFDKALQVAKTSDAEVLAINGDLSGRVFNEKEKEYFIGLSNTLMRLMPEIHKVNDKVRTIHDAAEFLNSNNIKVEGNLRKIGEDYLKLEEKVKERMLNNYKEFKQRFDSLEQKVILIPGNWDYKYIDDVLSHENIHDKYPEEINGIKFVGYGGAREHPKELPLDLTIHFNEDEAYSHLCKFEDAEVALFHTVPRGFESNGSHPGEYSLLAYLFRNTPSLVLTAHTHKPFIAKEEKTSAIVANPGNLGRYENGDFGTFLELEIDENYFVNPKAMYKINGNSVETHELKERISQ